MTTAKWLLVQALLFQQAVAGFAFVVIVNRNTNINHPDSRRCHLATTPTRTTTLLQQQQSTLTAVAEPTMASLQVPVAVQSSLPSVLRPSSTTTRAHTEQWQQALVPRPWENPRGVDVTVQWDAADDDDDECITVAQQLLRDASHKNDPRTILQSDLTASLRAFSAFCRAHADVLSSSSSSSLRLKARLVATRGSPGTKCPQWHLDHVPVRWIQALTGPGCLWIANPDEAVCWDRINALNDNDNDDDDDIVLDHTSNDRNQLLVDATRAVVEQAAPGEAVLLLGQEWPDPSVRPAVHKSPEIQRPWQGRVLLTMDVVLDDDDCCS